MKKIMFNDKYGLTEAVLSGRKTQTRRMCRHQRPDESYEIVFPVFCAKDYDEQGNCKSPLSGAFGWRNNEGDFTGWNVPRYKVGEVVAVAQSYRDCVNFPHHPLDKDGYPIIPKTSGYSNKMFVRADLMPHHIRITGVRVERLQDISDEDCIREGIMEGEFMNTWDRYYFDIWGDCALHKTFKTPHKAFAALTDRISGRGTWDSNPWVFVYDFELVD